MAVVKWKQGFLSDFLPVVHWQRLSRTRMVRCCTEPEMTGDAYKWTYVLFVSQLQLWSQVKKCVPAAKNRTVSEHTDLLFTGSWLTWARKLMVTPDLVGLKSQSTSYLTWLHCIVFENFKATFAKKFDKEYYFRDKTVPKANG